MDTPARSRAFFFPSLTLAGDRTPCGDAFAASHDTELGALGVCACGAVTLLLFSDHVAAQAAAQKRESVVRERVSTDHTQGNDKAKQRKVRRPFFPSKRPSLPKKRPAPPRSHTWTFPLRGPSSPGSHADASQPSELTRRDVLEELSASGSHESTNAHTRDGLSPLVLHPSRLFFPRPAPFVRS
jgi:hypothetical protein